MCYTKKFAFRRQLKNLNLKDLRLLREKHVGYMIDFMGFDDKEASKHSRYIGYIDNEIKKLM